MSDGRKGYGTTSFMLFAKMKRREILGVNPRTRQEEITTMCGLVWKSMPEEKKAMFKMIADRYNQARKNGLDPQSIIDEPASIQLVDSVSMAGVLIPHAYNLNTTPVPPHLIGTTL